jgi:hypothetical protein
MDESPCEKRRYTTREVAKYVGIDLKAVDNLASIRVIRPDHQQARRRRRLWSWRNVLEIALTRRGLMSVGLPADDAGWIAKNVFRDKDKMAWEKIRDGANVAVVIHYGRHLNPPDAIRQEFGFFQYDDQADLQNQISSWQQQLSVSISHYPVVITVDLNALVQQIIDNVKEAEYGK